MPGVIKWGCANAISCSIKVVKDERWSQVPVGSKETDRSGPSPQRHGIAAGVNKGIK